MVVSLNSYAKLHSVRNISLYRRGLNKILPIREIANVISFITETD